MVPTLEALGLCPSGHIYDLALELQPLPVGTAMPFIKAGECMDTAKCYTSTIPLHLRPWTLVQLTLRTGPTWLCGKPDQALVFQLLPVAIVMPFIKAGECVETAKCYASLPPTSQALDPGPIDPEDWAYLAL